MPVELGRLTQLEVLHLPNNQLSGEIPAELGNLANLKRLWLSGNELTGEIPSELGRLISLERMWLSGNRLTGHIPPELGSLTKLMVLMIHYNQLSGDVPSELSNLVRLQSLRLNNNNLTGPIPSELGNLSRLEDLRLDNNQLSGCMPGNLREQLTADPGIPFCCRTIFRESIAERVTSPSYLKWEIGDGVSEEDRRNAIHAAGLIHDYAISMGLPEIGSELTMYIHDDLDALAAIYARLSGNSVRDAREFWENNGGVADDGWAIINRSSQRVQSELSRDLRLTIAHELFHVYQAELADLSMGAASDAVPQVGPRWLSEGVADYFTYRALNAGGVLDYECARGSVDPWGFVQHGKYVDRPLKEMETWAGFSGVRGNAYSYSLLAAELLTSFASEEAVLRFYQYLEPGITWQAAFQKAFRMPVEEFYIFFEEHGAAGFPRVSTYISGHPNFIFGPDVPEEWRRQILDDMEVIRRWFADDMRINVDETLPSGFTVFIFGDGSVQGVKERRLDAFLAFREDLKPADREVYRERGAGLGWGQGHWEYFMACTCRLPRTRLSLAHEFVHAIQGNLSEGWRQRPPVWHIEGMAEHLFRVLAADRGMEKCTPNRCNGVGSFNDFLLAALDYPPLETQETREGLAGLHYGYASGMVASAILAELASMPSLMEFYSLIGQGYDWQDAFREAFGMTVSEFYNLYERSKGDGFPEVPQEVRDLP